MHSKFVADAMKTKGTQSLWSTNGQIAQYPVARVTIKLDGEEYVQKVVVAADLLLLGVNVPIKKHLVKCLGSQEAHLLQALQHGKNGMQQELSTKESSYVTTTRAQVRKQELEDSSEADVLTHYILWVRTHCTCESIVHLLTLWVRAH